MHSSFMENVPSPSLKQCQPILVVDDDVEYLKYMELELRAAGHRPQTASSGRDAMEILARARYPLVIADLCMPDMSGFELLAEVRAIDPLTVGIIMTAFGTVDSALDAVRRGAYDYLFKPSSSEVILTATRRALEHHTLQESVIAQAAKIESLERDYKKTVRVLREVSEHLRDPLTVISGSSSSLSQFSQPPRGEADADALQRSVGLIQSNTRLMAVILNELDDRVAAKVEPEYLGPLPLASSDA